MNKQQKEHLDHLKRCKKSSPESKFDWLAAALEFFQAKKKMIDPK